MTSKIANSTSASRASDHSIAVAPRNGFGSAPRRPVPVAPSGGTPVNDGIDAGLPGSLPPASSSPFA